MFPQCVAPFLVSTNMTNNMEVNCFVKSAAGFARDALNTVGYSSYTSGCLSHALQVRNERHGSHSGFQLLQHLPNINILTLSLSSITLQRMALTMLLPDQIRMSSFLIEKLQNFAKISKHEIVCKENDKLREREE